MWKRLGLFVWLICALVLSSCASTSVGVPGTGDVEVTQVDLGKAVGVDNDIQVQERIFKANETVYGAVATQGSGSAELKVRWLFDGEVVVEESSITAGPGKMVRVFQLSKPEGLQIGDYRFEVYLNETLAKVIEFDVTT
jgi:hypothetical protein